MANADHLEQIFQGVAAWNNWRLRNLNILDPDLRGATLIPKQESEAFFTGMDLSGAYLRGANLTAAEIQGANLNQADIRGANLNEANLSGATLKEANLSGAILRGVKLSSANLTGANLRGAVLDEANLIGACLDRADLTDARLWETQRSRWSIKDVICQRAFWDMWGKEPSDYKEGEFERIFAEKPRIMLRYPGGMSPIDLLVLPIVVERLQTEHPDSVLQIRSMQNDAGGASVTITVEDRTRRSPKVFGQELVSIQTKLECVVEERDHLRQLLASGFSQGLLKIAEFLALPRQEVHIYGPTGLTAIEGPTTMSRDTYNVPGQAGAVGPGAHAHDNTFQQIQVGIDLPKLAEELGRLRAAMKGEATGTREQDKAIGAVADAEEAATKGDGPAVFRYLKGAGTWALGISEKIGVAVATDYLKKAI